MECLIGRYTDARAEKGMNRSDLSYFEFYLMFTTRRTGTGKREKNEERGIRELQTRRGLNNGTPINLQEPVYRTPDNGLRIRKQLRHGGTI